MSTYKDKDNCTDILLDFIAGGLWGDILGNPSGESDGRYNAVIGNAYSSDDLSRRTLQEIYNLQSNLVYVKHRPSSAVGRYQIISPTLKTLVARKNLKLTTLFTNELQDQMAVDLMVGRGYKAWWTDRLTDKEFMHGLSMEWASLPDPNNGGKSHYDGIGPNHSSTNLANFSKALVEAKKHKP